MPRKPVSAVRNAARLLRAFSASDRELGVTELATRLGLTKSTVHRLLTTLAGERLIEQDPVSHRYRLGLTLYELGCAVSPHLELHEVVAPSIDQLHYSTSCGVQVAILDGIEVVYVERRESQATLRGFVQLGHRNVAHATSTGKVLLASLPRAELERRYAGRCLVERTPHTITDMASLLAELDRVRHQGYAENVNESAIGIASVAAPIRDELGQVTAAISVAAPIAVLTPEKKRRNRAATLEAAAEISDRLGYREWRTSTANVQ